MSWLLQPFLPALFPWQGGYQAGPGVNRKLSKKNRFFFLECLADTQASY